MNLANFLVLLLESIQGKFKSFEKVKSKYFEMFLIKGYIKKTSKGLFELTIEGKEYLREKIYSSNSVRILPDEAAYLLFMQSYGRTVRKSTIILQLYQMGLVKWIFTNCFTISSKGGFFCKKLKQEIRSDYEKEFFSFPKFRLPKENDLALEAVRQTLDFDGIAFYESTEESWVYFFGPFSKKYIENEIKRIALCE